MYCVIDEREVLRKKHESAGRRKIERRINMYKDVFNGMQLFAEEGATDQGADGAGASAA